MKSTGILETIPFENAKKNSYAFLLIEKLLVENNFDWLHCVVVKNKLLGQGYLKSNSSGKKYKILIKYTYDTPPRFDRIWIVEPDIPFNSKTHMYIDNTLCLYHPKDLPIHKITPLATMLPWISEWIGKYEFWQKYRVWLGEEAPH